MDRIRNPAHKKKKMKLSLPCLSGPRRLGEGKAVKPGGQRQRGNSRLHTRSEKCSWPPPLPPVAALSPFFPSGRKQAGRLAAILLYLVVAGLDTIECRIQNRYGRINPKKQVVRIRVVLGSASFLEIRIFLALGNFNNKIFEQRKLKRIPKST